MDDRSIEQFSRQMLLPEWGVEAQQQLAGKRVLVVGCGGLGSSSASWLARAGVGQLCLVDDDQIDLSNLHRQQFRPEQLGQFKSQALATNLNGFTDAEYHVVKVDRDWLLEYGGAFDLWLDGSDNQAVRVDLSCASVELGVPWVMGAAVALSGQLATFDPNQEGSACWHCVFGEQREALLNCEQAGVLGPVVGLVATLQAQWALAYLGAGTPLPVNQLQRFDGLHLSPMKLAFSRKTTCDNCAGTP